MTSKYRNIPVDLETYQAIKTLAQAKGFGERGMGAVVRVMAKAETEKLPLVKPQEPAADITNPEPQA